MVVAAHGVVMVTIRTCLQLPPQTLQTPSPHSSIGDEFNDKRDQIRDINEEERSTVRQRMSRDTGCTGLSVLQRLFPLYGFLYDESTVYDEMHTISLNLVKNALLDLRDDDSNGIDWSVVDDRLDHTSRPSGMFLSNFHCFCFVCFFFFSPVTE